MDQNKLRQGAHHINYEIRMLKYAFSKLRDNQGRIESILALECFLLHARNLIDFIYYPYEKKRQDDVESGQFVSDRNKWDVFRVEKNDRYRFLVEDIRGRAHKLLAHVTYARGDIDKNWPTGKIIINLKQIFESYEKYIKDEFKSLFELRLFEDIFIEDSRIVDSTSSYDAKW